MPASGAKFGRKLLGKRVKVTRGITPHVGSISGAAHAPGLDMLARAFVPKHFVPRISSQLFKGRVGNLGGGGFRNFAGKF